MTHDTENKTVKIKQRTSGADREKHQLNMFVFQTQADAHVPVAAEVRGQR